MPGFVAICVMALRRPSSSGSRHERGQHLQVEIALVLPPLVQQDMGRRSLGLGRGTALRCRQGRTPQMPRLGLFVDLSEAPMG